MDDPAPHPPPRPGQRVALSTPDRAERVAGPAWATALRGGQVGVWAPHARVAAGLGAGTPVVLHPCDRRGRVADGAPGVRGTAQVLRSGGVRAEVVGRVHHDRGAWGRVARLLRPARHDVVVLLTPDVETAGQDVA